jgi:hypothetical protein
LPKNTIKTRLKSYLARTLKVRNQIAILFFSFLLTLSSFAQSNKKSVEVGLFLGGSYYIGDLNPIRHFDQFTKPGGGVVFRYNFNPRLAFRGNFLLGTIEAHDEFSPVAWQQQRNLSFQSQITEISAQLEFNFLKYQIGNEKDRFTPYIFGGMAGFRFEPQGQVGDEWYSLHSLSTEGQGLPGGPAKNYKLFQISLPFGVGIRLNVAKSMSLGLEWGMRKTFTDYLDDVSTRYYNPTLLEAYKGETAVILADQSIGTDAGYNNVGRQRGNPATKDWYSFAGAVLTIKINGKGNECPGVGK